MNIAEKLIVCKTQEEAKEMLQKEGVKVTDADMNAIAGGMREMANMAENKPEEFEKILKRFKKRATKSIEEIKPEDLKDVGGGIGNIFSADWWRDGYGDKYEQVEDVNVYPMASATVRSTTPVSGRPETTVYTKTPAGDGTFTQKHAEGMATTSAVGATVVTLAALYGMKKAYDNRGSIKAWWNKGKV